ncbi:MULTISPECIES: hypothetical protein [Streptomyces]|uniref:WXG100 family type VII secretion target n=1 Tax=Streptomyces changanensis TaxID=2964669 RepID=A0ABY5NGJ6_9ACTN|nr:MULTISPECIES: hypothetical protein [Streptomyces]UUS35119.1 hypothetical protein NRO40_30435 [Streptomyces changanensis]
MGDYLAQLVVDDVSGLRARAMDAAQRFLSEQQALFDEAEHGSRWGGQAA